MDYEQKYAKALWQMKELYNRVKYMSSTEALLVSQTLENTFPELKESEDERIRKGLIKGLSAMRDIHKHTTFSDDAINIDDAIAWLEKQGEQKPAWSEDDEKIYNEIIDFFLGDIETRCTTIDKQRHFGYWLKSLKDRVQSQPKQEWSEEEIDLLLSNLDRNIKEFVTTDEFENEIGGHYWAIAKHAFLLGLGYSRNWKPSDEQMQALETAIRCRSMPWEQLGTLYNDLKKL